MRIAVTGGSGAAGRVIIRGLAALGHEIRNLDLVACEDLPCAFTQLSLTNYDETLGALESTDAIVHFGSTPYPDEDHRAAAERFSNNTCSTYNVFNAATASGIRRVVWASSETVFGYPFRKYSPPQAPLTEEMIAPQNAYAMSKRLCEILAEMICDLHPEQTIIGLRLSNILYADALASEEPRNVPFNRRRDTYHRLPDYWDDVSSRDFNLWNYIDARDVVRAVRCALDVAITGAHSCSIIANDTIMDRPTRELIAARFPQTKIDPCMGVFEAMVSNHWAYELLGFKPEWSWRDVAVLKHVRREHHQ